MGLIWVVLWLFTYQVPQKHSKVSSNELEYIVSDSREEESVPISWLKFLSYRQAQAICLLKFATDWVWWFLLFWIPDLLNKMFDVDIKELVLPLIIIYTMASIGGIGGGWLSSSMIKNGKSIDYARKTAMIICAS